MENLKNKIEGIIFISDAPVKAKEIAEFLKEDLIKVKESIQELELIVFQRRIAFYSQPNREC